MHKVENNITNMDSSAWPSSYYGRTRRIDLEKFYQEITKASQPCKKRVTFSPDPPKVHEYEAEYDITIKPTNSKLFDDGWPGRTKKAMASTEFMDFKSKIEAKLGAINDASLLVQLDKNNNEMIDFSNQENRGYYRHRKSPLVQKLKLRPIPNPIMEPNLILDTPSPSSSYTDSPLTPRDNHALPIMGDYLNQSISSSSSNSTASSSLLSPNGSVRWLKSLTRMKSVSSKSK
jgi:hypothetical protein